MFYGRLIITNSLVASRSASFLNEPKLENGVVNKRRKEWNIYTEPSTTSCSATVLYLWIVILILQTRMNCQLVPLSKWLKLMKVHA